MTQRRQVGFIKTYNKTQQNFQQEPSEFSYFRINPKNDDEEFSPYKFQDEPSQMKNTIKAPKKPLSKPPLPQRTLQKAMTVSNLADRAKADQLYHKIRQNIASYEQKRSVGRQSLQENIGNIRNKIQKLDEVLNQMKTNKGPEAERRAASYTKIQRKFEEDSSSSSSKEEDPRVKAIPKPQMHNPQRANAFEITYNEQQRQVNYVPSENKYADEEEQQHEELQQSVPSHQESKPIPSQNQQPNVITFNSRLKNQPPLQIQEYSSSSSDPSQSEDTEQISEEHLQRLPERQLSTHNQKVAKQLYKNKGGVCFDIDVKQFTGPAQPQRLQRPAAVPKKKPKVDKREELLRRREAAKAYDKKARRTVFSPQY